MSDYGLLARTLGFQNPGGMTPLGIARSVEAGLPTSSLARLSKTICPNDVNFRHRLVPRATAARSKVLSHMASERVARVARIWSEAVSVWGGEEAARTFLFRPHAMLDDQPPMTVTLKSEMGAELVSDILGRLRYGSAA